MRVHPSLLYHRLQSLVRSQGHHLPSLPACDNTTPLAKAPEFAWMTFGKPHRSRALGIRLRPDGGENLCYEVAEHHRSGKLRVTRWQFDCDEGWRQLRIR